MRKQQECKVKDAQISWRKLDQNQRYHVQNSGEQRGLFNPSYCPPKANLNFSIDLEYVRSGKDKRRTVMLKNIPNSLSQNNVMELIDMKFKGCYDYFYLPIDFKYHRNVGYAFVNLNSTETVIRFVTQFQGMKWKSSHKVADVTYARTQGLKALTQAAKKSQVGKTQNDPRLKPVILKLR